MVFLAVASVYLLRAMLAFAKGDLRRVRELLGARSVEEEMEFEKESLGLATAGRPMTLVAILVLLLILVLAVPVAAGLGWLGLVLNQLYSPISLIVTTGEVTWSTTTSFILVAVPFYVLMGEIMLRTGMAERMYAAIAQWVSWLPGGLMHSNVVACAVWGAPSGSSVATAVTVGTVAIGEIKKHNYNEPLFLGTIAAGGTLGILIPPSINMVVYGAMTDTSIPKLYLAGFIPGFVLSILFMATVLVACLWRPAWGGTPVVTSWEARIRTLPGLLPPLVILAAVIGSIYIGWATATEAAALGILAAFAYAAYERSLSVKVIGEIFEGTARTTGMIMAIVIGAYFLNVVITTIGLPNQIGTLVKSLDLSPFGTLMLIIVFYHHPRHVHGDALHDGRDHSDHHADRRAGRLRSGLVRHPRRAADGDRAADAAGRHEPVRRAGHPRARRPQ